MARPAIRVEGLSKRYRIGARKSRKTFREAIVEGLTAPLRRLRSFGQSSHRESDSIWALKDVSFSVQPGEVVGIIGRNGAGKTTLLRVLSQITEPTEGCAVIRGRVGSLLEVGTGFHSELTGRENTYLSGAILGMSKREIERKFEEIVEFSGVGQFIDTPVKRYSSGMRVRLGFAVAAHLEPEILLIDEVLAVGDAAFQKKCLGKMGDVARAGRTVLFVSHNMDAIRRLCRRALLIADGSLALDADSKTTITSYLGGGPGEKPNVRVFSPERAPGDRQVCLKAVRTLNHAGKDATEFSMDESIQVEVEFEVLEALSDFHTYIRVLTQDGVLVFGSADWDDGSAGVSRFTPGSYLASCSIPGSLLNAGVYSLTVMGHIPHVRYVFTADNVLQWEVFDMGGAGGTISSGRPGIIRPRLEWSVKSLGESRLRSGSSDPSALSR